MNAHTLCGCVRLRRKTTGTVIDTTVKCESEGGERQREEGLFMRDEGRKRERAIKMCQPSFLVCSLTSENRFIKIFMELGNENKATFSQDGTFLICLIISLVTGLNIFLT